MHLIKSEYLIVFVYNSCNITMNKNDLYALTN